MQEGLNLLALALRPLMFCLHQGQAPLQDGGLQLNVLALRTAPHSKKNKREEEEKRGVRRGAGARATSCKWQCTDSDVLQDVLRAGGQFFLRQEGLQVGGVAAMLWTGS